MASNVNLDVSENLNITAKRGDSFSLTVTLKDSAGTALTLSSSNYEFFFIVKQATPARGSSTQRIVLSTPNVSGSENTFEDTVVDDSGNATFNASSQVMSKISSGAYNYEIQYRIPSTTGIDTYTTFLKGSFALNTNIRERA
jgi:hypothetical protein|tara:strand:- start:27 stop:452 length:426 start_codon:yes stop_codon:yes gene_type:complete